MTDWKESTTPQAALCRRRLKQEGAIDVRTIESGDLVDVSSLNPVPGRPSNWIRLVTVSRDKKPVSKREAKEVARSLYPEPDIVDVSIEQKMTAVWYATEKR
jgi:hypothetical protein